MPTTGRYAAYRKADVILQETGYLKAWINILTDFTTLLEPNSTGTLSLGEIYRINSAHTWAAGKEAVPVYVKKDTLEANAESSGEKSSMRLIFQPKLFIIGDGSQILEMVNNWMNEQLILFVQDQCNPAKHLQFGCQCLPAEAVKASFTSGTLKGGSKGYTLEIESYCKFFYNAAVSERA